MQPNKEARREGDECGSDVRVREEREREREREGQ
jgi:hypothetical protein